MIILGIHAGQHEASATLFDDYRVLAAVQKWSASTGSKEPAFCPMNGLGRALMKSCRYTASHGEMSMSSR